MTNPEIKGFIETSFCDWDGKISSVVFLPGCNFRCPFCQNAELIEAPAGLPTIQLDVVLHYLDSHRDWIDGVVITGGEPTIRRELASLIGSFRAMGLGIKLDTNGTRPDVLSRLLDGDLVDFFAMDIKAPLDRRYERAAGTPVDIDAIRRSIDIIRGHGDYEFRTTLVPGLVGEAEVLEIAREIRGSKRYVLQRFVPENSLDSSLRQAIPYHDDFISRLVNAARRHVDSCFYRGKIGAELS
jgi:pyruvate formate lyase activating enzyme